MVKRVVLIALVFLFGWMLLVSAWNLREGLENNQAASQVPAQQAPQAPAQQVPAQQAPVQPVQPAQDPNAKTEPIIATKPNELVVPSPDPIPQTASSLLSAASLVDPKAPAPSPAPLASPIINIYVNTDPSKMSTSRVNIAEANGANKEKNTEGDSQEKNTEGDSQEKKPSIRASDATTKVEKYNY
jgi:hypothetical protein